MPDKSPEFDPFHSPTPYAVLEIENGLQASAKDIGRAYNTLKRKARSISDVKARAARVEALDRAKEQLQRPENRVLIDFFLLGDALFADLCRALAARLATREMPVRTALRKVIRGGRYDDLLPRPLEQFEREFELPGNVHWYEEARADDGPLELVAIE